MRADGRMRANQICWASGAAGERRPVESGQGENFRRGEEVAWGADSWEVRS